MVGAWVPRRAGASPAGGWTNHPRGLLWNAEHLSPPAALWDPGSSASAPQLTFKHQQFIAPNGVSSAKCGLWVSVPGEGCCELTQGGTQCWGISILAAPASGLQVTWFCYWHSPPLYFHNIRNRQTNWLIVKKRDLKCVRDDWEMKNCQSGWNTRL